MAAAKRSWVGCPESLWGDGLPAVCGTDKLKDTPDDLRIGGGL